MTSSRPASNRVFTLLLIAAFLIALGYAIRHTFSCFLLAFTIAYLLDSILMVLERYRLSRNTGIVVIYTLGTIFSIFFLVYLAPFLSLRWESMIRELPHYLQKGKEIAEKWQGTEGGPFATSEWGWIAGNLFGGMDELFSRIGSGIYGALSRVVFNLFNLVLAPILVFFMLFYKSQIKDGIASWLPPAYSKSIMEVGREVNASIGGYIKGQLFVSLIVAVLAAAALLFLDIDYPMFNGLFAGLASILPFIGVILAVIPPLFFAYVKFQSGLVILKVIAAFAVIYFLEGYLVKPLVFKEAMNLNPLVTIIAVMGFGEMMGFWGILLAIPIAATIQILSSHFRSGEFSERSL
jgi:putative permease